MILKFILLIVGGGIAGFINTMSGGGSVFSLTFLILFGVPSNIANATNRIGIFSHKITSLAALYKHNIFPIKDNKYIIAPVVAGGICGTLLAKYVSAAVFDKVLIVVLIFVVIMNFMPNKKKLSHHTKSRFWHYVLLFIAGFYGGFIQLGVGLLLIAVLQFIMDDMNLLEINALKLNIIMIYTVIAVTIFIMSGKINWTYAIPLGIGNIIGGQIGVHSAIKKGDKFIKYVIMVSIFVAVLKLIGVFDLIIARFS